MDVNRLRFGEMIAGIAAALLFLVSFLPWWGVPTVLGGETVTFTTWSGDLFFIDSIIAIVLVVTVLVAVGLGVLTMTQRTVALPVSASVLVTALGGFLALLILYRIINQPGPNSIVETRFWVYIAFLCALGVAFGGYMSMRDEDASFGSAASRMAAQTRPAPPPAPSGTQAPDPAAPPPPPADATRVSAPPPPAPPSEGGEPR